VFSLHGKISLFILLMAVLMSLPLHVYAKTADCGNKRARITAGTLDEMTWKKLNDIYEDVGEERFDLAFEKLQKMYGRAYDDYQKALISQALAQVEWARSNYDSALVNFETAVGLDVLPDATHYLLMYQIAQLYYLQARYDEALARLALWMCKAPEEKITAVSYVLKASIYAQKKDWKNVVPAIERAISLAEEPMEAWYQLLLAAQYELEQFSQATQTLETLIQSWPDKKRYWLQLSRIYYQLNMQSDALSVLALGYRRNMLETQSDIMYLSSLYSNNDVPFKAAEVLQKGMEDGFVGSDRKHWTMVGDAWYAAEEMDKALVAYENAGMVSNDGEIDLRRAYILVDMERWIEASDAINSALEKGGFSDKKTGDAFVLQGMSEFMLGNYKKAGTAWGHARKYPETNQSAQQWINHMREERARDSS
jgi:tetratricopeptide (TPR) repeat protein